MQLQGIVFIQLQETYLILSFQGNIFTQRKKLFTKNIFIQFKEIVFTQGIVAIQGNYIHSRKYVYSRKLYSFNNVEFLT